MMGGFTRYGCPLSACDWHHDEPTMFADPMRMLEPPEAAARRLERLIRAHVETHPVEEWMREIQQLRDELFELNELRAARAVDDEDTRRGV